MAELYLVRHAQASFEAADYDRLSPLGERQSRWLGEYFALRGLAFDAWVTGTHRRHHQTIEGIRQGLELVPQGATLRLPGLDEYDFRALVEAFERLEPGHVLVRARAAEPRDKSAFYRVLRLAILAWSEGRLDGRVPETWHAFRGRIDAAAAELQTLSAGHRRILAVSSGGTMAALLGGLLGLEAGRIVDLNLQIRNTSVSHFYLNAERFLLATWNAAPHLETAGREDAITFG